MPSANLLRAIQTRWNASGAASALGDLYLDHAPSGTKAPYATYEIDTGSEAADRTVTAGGDPTKKRVHITTEVRFNIFAVGGSAEGHAANLISDWLKENTELNLGENHNLLHWRFVEDFVFKPNETLTQWTVVFQAHYSWKF